MLDFKVLDLQKQLNKLRNRNKASAEQLDHLVKELKKCDEENKSAFTVSVEQQRQRYLG